MDFSHLNTAKNKLVKALNFDLASLTNFKTKIEAVSANVSSFLSSV